MTASDWFTGTLFITLLLIVIFLTVGVVIQIRSDRKARRDQQNQEARRWWNRRK